MNKLTLLLLIILFVFFSCAKEEMPSRKVNRFNLSVVEKDFFNFHKQIGLSFRNDHSYRITPEVIRVHQHILEENNIHHFAGGINILVGTPLWNQAYTFKTSTSDFYVLVPLFNRSLNIINGYLSGMNTPTGIVLNGLTRSTLLDNLNVNSAIKKSTLTILAKQEKILTGTISPDIDAALCTLRDEIVENGIHFDDSEVLIDDANPCSPVLKEICIDQEGGYHWFGGITNLPLHLDHDQDGIINSQDQDWAERRFNMTQEQFTQFVLDHWDEHMQDKYGDYYDFWDQMGDYNNGYAGGQDWEEFIDELEYFWENFADFWEDVWYDLGDLGDDIGDWFGDLFEGDIDCPEWPFHDEDNILTTRSIECFTFYAWDCNDNPGTNWWQFFNWLDEDAVYLQRVYNHWQFVLHGQVDLQTLYQIAEDSGCDPLLSDFERCLDWHFNQYRDAILIDMYEQMFPNVNFLPTIRWLARNCELGGMSPAVYNSCILDQFASVNQEIQNFLSAGNIDISVEDFLEIYMSSCKYCNILEFEQEALLTLGLAGQDWVFDEAFWSDPNLSFPLQELPSYQDVYNAFPRNNDGTVMHGADNVYNLVGGDVSKARLNYPVQTRNTCALKVSIALNGSGIDIPHLLGETLEGSDGKFYFLNAKALCTWMQLTFEDYVDYEDWEYSDPDFYSVLNGQRGIIISLYEGKTETGHSDVYTGSRCLSSYDCNVEGIMYWWALD